MTRDTTTRSTTGLFPATAWTLIRHAQQLPQAQYEASRNEFLARYWKPVFCFLRARGYPPAEAEDLSQGFFVRFLEKDALRKADREKGRFRTFLLTILDRFLSDLQDPRRQSRQRRFERGWVSISTLGTPEDRSFEPSEDETPDAVFMKQWAAALMRSVQEQLRRRCEDASRPEWYALFASLYGEDADGAHPTQAALAERSGLSLDQVKYALDQTRGWFTAALVDEVRQHVDSDEDVMIEIRELRHWLGAGSAPGSAPE
jgi:DNA-directed RNA polymerase specialized sigma24 family protein